jgi:hypothetical protein
MSKYTSERVKVIPQLDGLSPYINIRVKPLLKIDPVKS